MANLPTRSLKSAAVVGPKFAQGPVKAGLLPPPPLSPPQDHTPPDTISRKTTNSFFITHPPQLPQSGEVTPNSLSRTNPGSVPGLAAGFPCTWKTQRPSLYIDGPRPCDSQFPVRNLSIFSHVQLFRELHQSRGIGSVSIFGALAQIVGRDSLIVQSRPDLRCV